MVSVLDSGAEGPGFKSQPRRCRITVLGKPIHTHRASVHQAAKLVAARLRVAGVTAGLAENNGSLPPGLWLTSSAGWLSRTGISSGTLRMVIEYGLTFLVGVQLLLNCYTVAAPQTQVRPPPLHRPSSRIRIVLLDINGGLRNVSQTAVSKETSPGQWWCADTRTHIHHLRM